MLSEQLDDLSRQHGAVAYQDRSGYQRYGFTPAGLLNLLAEVNSEVRKQDTALIRQLVDALDTAFHQTCSVGRPKDWEQIRNALHSARARLEDAK